MKHHFKHFGFTLAEVLITLGIIGIVAALTMPSLIADYQKKQTVKQLKRTYSLLNQAIKMEIVENGGDLSTWYNKGGAYGDGDPGTDYLIPHLKVVSTFHRNSNVQGYHYNNPKAYVMLHPNGKGLTGFYNARVEVSPYAYVLNDGTVILFVNFLNYSPMGNAFFILVDLNGRKGPNRVGRDVFVFIWTKAKPDRISFYGENRTADELITGAGCPTKEVAMSISAGYAGWGCSTLIVKDGWEIKEHYPWW